jgi:hypothetical protein
MKTILNCILFFFLLSPLFAQVDSSRIISGSLQCFNYWPISGQTVVLTDTLNGQTLEQAVDSSGFFTFRNVPTGRTYQLSLKNSLPPIDTFRAVSVLDVVKMSHHILNIRPLEGLALNAADLNESFGVTTFDIVLVLRALQGKGELNYNIRRASILKGTDKVYSHNIIPNFTTSLRGLQFVYFIKGDVDGSGCP